MLDNAGAFNLVREAWIPVRRRSGRLQWIAPWQITETIDGDDPFVALAAPRPDFSGAITEFLIGLVTTAAAPADDAAWRQLGTEPPTPENLRARFEAVASAFVLDGLGPRFLQDFDAEFEGEERSVAALLIDAPGDNALRKNTDHFVKRGGAPALSRAAAAMALYALQTYAPSGGQGHRTSLRGGGPLTTLAVLGDRLWDRIWPNVETQEQLAMRQVEGPHEGPGDIFPWMAPTRVSDKSGRATTAADAHPLQAYWGMPRRIRLVFSPAEGERCALTNREDPVLVRALRTRNFGVNYAEGWTHPLSPHYRQKTGGPLLPVHGQTGGVSYRDWLGLAISDPESTRVPATCVRHVQTNPRLLRRRQRRLWVFGYDMDNMKARGWIDSEMPLLAQEHGEDLRYLATAQVRAAEIAAFALTTAVKSALFERPSDARGDFGFIAERFWRETEQAFFANLNALLQTLEGADADDPAAPLRRDWRHRIERSALAVFDSLVSQDGLENAAMKRLVGARFGLVLALRGLSKQGRKLFEHLSLPLRATKKPRKPKRETAA